MLLCVLKTMCAFTGFEWFSVADPGFPVGGAHLVGGAPTPDVATFLKFLYQSERVGTLGGGARRVRPFWIRQWFLCLKHPVLLYF